MAPGDAGADGDGADRRAGVRAARFDYVDAPAVEAFSPMMGPERGTLVKENWWSLLNYLYYEQENWPKVLEILGILVKDFPKREYWIQLAGIHGQEGHEMEQLGAMEAAHAGDFLREERDFTTLAGLLMQAEVPYRAARILDKNR